MTNDIPLKPFYMIRHGETEANAAKIMSGQIDTPLTEEGHKQAQTAAQLAHLLDPKPSVVVHSFLQRTRDTAGYLNAILNLQLIEQPNWAEQDFGEWQGYARDKIMPFLLAQKDAPGGESAAVFNNRIKAALVETLAMYDNPLIVCHGGCFRAFAHLYNQPFERVDNCVLHAFEPAPEQDDFPWKIYEYCPQSREKKPSRYFYPNKNAA